MRLRVEACCCVGLRAVCRVRNVVNNYNLNATKLTIQASVNLYRTVRYHSTDPRQFCAARSFMVINYHPLLAKGMAQTVLQARQQTLLLAPSRQRYSIAISVLYSDLDMS